MFVDPMICLEEMSGLVKTAGLRAEILIKDCRLRSASANDYMPS